MERLRRRVDAIVDDPETAEALKPYYRFLCKRPCSSDEYLPTFNRPNVTLVDVSESKGVERLTEKGIVANGVEYEVDCVIFASGFEISTEISRRYAIDAIEGRDGAVALRPLAGRLQDAARDHQPRLPQPVPHRLHPGRRLGQHHGDVRAAGRAHRLHHLRSRGARRDDRRTEPRGPRQLGQDHPRNLRSTTRRSKSSCTPGYYNNEGGGGGEGIRSFLGEFYSPGFYAFDDLLASGATRATSMASSSEIRCLT